jgi:hypothetical protein
MIEVFYFDKNGEPCDKADAVKVVIRETDAAGNVLQETWAECGKK